MNPIKSFKKWLAKSHCEFCHQRFYAKEENPYSKLCEKCEQENPTWFTCRWCRILICVIGREYNGFKYCVYCERESDSNSKKYEIKIACETLQIERDKANEYNNLLDLFSLRAPLPPMDIELDNEMYLSWAAQVSFKYAQHMIEERKKHLK